MNRVVLWPIVSGVCASTETGADRSVIGTAAIEQDFQVE